MPTAIVTETCPAPECNLTVGDIVQFVDELARYVALFANAWSKWRGGSFI
jgi:hypothetical protein